MNKTNTYPMNAAQMLTMHQNTVEVMAKLDQVLTSDQAHVSIEQTNPIDGSVTVTEAPTIGNFMARLARIEETMKVLTGMSGNPVAVHVANNAYKRLILADVNLEPNDISTLDSVGTFRADKNWFFDGLLNPSLSVEFDLTGKVQHSVRKIQSRRFIVRFSKDADGNFTADAKLRQQEFNDRYKGRNNVDLADFVAWLTNTKQAGIANRREPLVDDQTFDLLPHRLKYNGSFSVLGTEQDTLNKKLWYKLDTLNYQDVGNPYAAPTVKQLAVGDEVAVTPNVQDQSATTVYTVAEISTVTTDNRVRFERKSGQDAIPVRSNALKIYSPVVYDKRVRITISNDEYNVIFVKPLHADNHLLSLNWSKGVGFYSSDLRLETTTGKSLKDYYISTVYDYGAVLQDLVAKKIPSDQGIQPLAPNLVFDNFKVVQLNKHLTDSVDAEKIRELNQQYNTYKSEVEQLQTAVQNKQKQISNKGYASDADRASDQAELSQLSEQATSKNELMSSIIKKILQQQKNLNKISPKFVARAFFAMPDPIVSPGTTPQEVVQFEYQVKYSSKAGSQPAIQQFNIAPPLDSTGIAADKKAASGAFSNWSSYKTDVRRRVQDAATGEYIWQIEDVESADTPNINQLEIPLSPGETVFVKVRSISEVGWPEAPLLSEWSAIIEVPFPDDMDSLLSEDDFVLKEATQEEQRVRFTKDLDAKGVFSHIADTTIIGDTSYAHPSTRVSSGFVDDNGKMMSMYDYLRKLTTRIDALEEAVKRSKGELRVRLFKGDREFAISNGSELNVLVDLEDYATLAKTGLAEAPHTSSNRRTYVNTVNTIKDFYVLVENSAKENPLGLLSTRAYSSQNTSTSTPFALSPSRPQATWVDEDDTILFEQTTTVPFGNVKTQFNNQWIWLQVAKSGGGSIYTDGYAETATAATRNVYPAAATIHAALTSTGAAAGNYGLYTGLNSFKMGEPGNGTTVASTPVIRITRPDAWKVAGTTAGTFGTLIGTGSMAATIHPKVASKATIVETNADLVHSIEVGSSSAVNIPLLIYWKANTQNTPLSATDPNAAVPELIAIARAIVLRTTTDLTLSSVDNINLGDEIYLRGVTSPATINNIPLTVNSVSTDGSNKVNVNYNSTSQTITMGTGTVAVVGKRATQTATSPNVETVTYWGSAANTLAADAAFRITASNAEPQILNRSISMYLEPENSARAFQFTINFSLRQFKPVSLQ